MLRREEEFDSFPRMGGLFAESHRGGKDGWGHKPFPFGLALLILMSYGRTFGATPPIGPGFCWNSVIHEGSRRAHIHGSISKKNEGKPGWDKQHDTDRGVICHDGIPPLVSLRKTQQEVESPPQGAKDDPIELAACGNTNVEGAKKNGQDDKQESNQECKNMDERLVWEYAGVIKGFRGHPLVISR